MEADLAQKRRYGKTTDCIARRSRNHKWTSRGGFEFYVRRRRSERPPWDVKLWFSMNTTASNRDGLPESFLAQFGEHVTGFLSGFDRLPAFLAAWNPQFPESGRLALSGQKGQSKHW